MSKREKSQYRELTEWATDLHGCGVAKIVYTLYLHHLCINQKGLFSLPLQYFTYFNEHKLTGVMVAMPVQYELRRLFHLMNIQTHRDSTQKALFLGAYFNRWLFS